MSANKGKLRPALGSNPLSQGIFSKTEAIDALAADQTADQESINLNLDLTEESTLDLSVPALKSPQVDQESINLKQESINLNLVSLTEAEKATFLVEEATERINLRLSVEVNDWLDDLLKQGKRKHGRKIPKEVWVQAALEFFRALPVDWQAVNSEDSLREVLLNLESRIKQNLLD